MSVASVKGWLSFCEFLPRCEYRGAVEASIYVNEGFQRRGIGRGLLQQASARRPQLGMHSLVGLIFSHNEASIALFRAAGFKRRSFLPGVARIDQTLAPNDLWTKAVGKQDRTLIASVGSKPFTLPRGRSRDESLRLARK